MDQRELQQVMRQSRKERTRSQAYFDRQRPARYTTAGLFFRAKPMGHGRGKSATSYETAPVPVTNYNVTGPIAPDATCNYFLVGTYNGKPYYRREDGAWFIWRQADDTMWIISSGLGVYLPDRWERTAETVVGTYHPCGGALGDAEVSTGAH